MRQGGRTNGGRITLGHRTYRTLVVIGRAIVQGILEIGIAIGRVFVVLIIFNVLDVAIIAITKITGKSVSEQKPIRILCFLKNCSKSYLSSSLTGPAKGTPNVAPFICTSGMGECVRLMAKPSELDSVYSAAS